MNKAFENFKDRSNKIHNNKYDYSKFIYVTAKTPSIIICPIHGEFIQKPDHHTRKNAIGCPKCVFINRCGPKYGLRGVPIPQKRITPEIFLERARIKYGSRYEYDFSKYSGWTKGLVGVKCPIHGWKYTTPCNHLMKQNTYGCAACGRNRAESSKTKSYDQLIIDFRKTHGDRYFYPDSNRSTFVNRRSIVKIICSIHGQFNKKAQKHLSGQGCFPCKIEELVESGELPGGYCMKNFEVVPYLGEKPAKLYYLKIDQYFKIGITSVSIENRMAGLKSKSRNCGVDITECECLEYIDMTLYEAYLAEQSILSKFKEFRVYTKWSTELFKCNILENGLTNFLNTYQHIPINILQETLMA